MPAIISSPPRIKLDGAGLADGIADRLVGVEVLLSTQQSSRATLRFRDESYELLDKDFKSFEIGGRIAISLAEGTASTVEVFEGEIIGIGVEQSSVGGSASSDWGSLVTVEVASGSHRLAAAAHPTTWLDSTTKAVVEAVAGRHGLTPKITGAAAGSMKQPYLAQAGTDHALLDALARQIGFTWWTHGKELHFSERAAPSSAVTLTRGRELLSVGVHFDGRDTPKNVTVKGWDPTKTAAIVGKAKTAGADAEKALGSTASFVSAQHAAAKKAFGTELSLGELPTASKDDAAVVATAVERELLGEGLRVEATVLGDPAIRAGAWVELKELGTALSGKYYVTEVRHSFGPGEDLMTHLIGSRGGGRPAEWRSRLDSPGAGSWTTRGPVPAIVTNVDDPEKLGRVKVKFPSLDDTIESTWARIVAPGAGKNRGLDLRPRLDDEVLVVFSHGDHGLPYVLGGLWSEKNSHADGTTGNERDAVRSHEGALLTFHTADDAEGTGHELAPNWSEADHDLKGAVSLRSATESGLLVADAVVLSTEGKDIVITNGKATIRLLANGNIEIEGEELSIATNKDSKVEAKGKVNVEALEVTLKGKSKFAVDAPQSEVKSMAGIKLKSTKVEVGP